MPMDSSSKYATKGPVVDHPLPLPPSLAEYFKLFGRRYAWYGVLLLIIAFSSGLFRIEVDYELQHIIDSVATNPHAPMIALLLYFVLHKTLHHVVHFLQKLLSVYYKPRILQEVTEGVYAQVMRHSLCWFDSHLAGEISNKIHDFQDSLLNLLNGLFYVASHFFIVVLSLIFLSTVSFHATLVLVVFIGIYTPLMYLFLRRQMDLEEKCAKVRQETFGVINDSLGSVFSLKTMGRLSWEFALTLRPVLKKWRDHETKSRRYHAYYVDITDTVLVVIMGAVQITLIAHLYRQGLLTPGQFAFVTILTLQVHRELAEMIEKIVFLCNPKIAALKASYGIMSLSPQEKEPLETRSMPALGGKIEYRRVSFGYDSKDLILKNLNLTIPSGQRVGIVGPSGAGKSTFVKALLKYFPLTEGAIFVDDGDISRITQEELCAHITVIPQETSLFHRSVLDNLRMVKPSATLEEIHSICEKAHIHKDILAMGGYEVLLGERGVKLSGGQRQRLAIARAMLKNAPIMILDEATSALDTPTERLIQASLDAIIEESRVTTLMVAHRLSTLVGMDRILVFDHGCIVQDGTHEALLAQGEGLYKKLWDSQGNSL